MKISKDITVGEIVRKYPETLNVLFSFGLGCVGCPSAQIETIEDVCRVHGLNIDELLKTLNEVV